MTLAYLRTHPSPKKEEFCLDNDECFSESISLAKLQHDKHLLFFAQILLASKTWSLKKFLVSQAVGEGFFEVNATVLYFQPKQWTIFGGK